MLRSLHVKNLALIQEIEVEFGEGLNILTGETGAGKSILLGSVNLALGSRYTKDQIRAGAEYGLVELLFQVTGASTRERLESLSIYPEDGYVSISRRIMEGRSVCRINGETVSLSQVKEAASVLIDIHGQQEHQTLLDKKSHIGFVDAYAGAALTPVKEKVQAAYGRWKEKKKALDETDMDASQRERELSFLQFEVQEIKEAALTVGEDEELEALYKRMNNARKIAEDVGSAYAYTSGDPDSASENISRALRSLSEISDYEAEAGALYDELSQIDSLLNDFNRDLSDYQGTLDYGEEAFYETENRLNEINRLKVKYGNRIEDILAYQAKQEEKIQQLNDYETYRANLEKEVQEAEAELSSCTRALSRIRRDTAAVMEKEITRNLKDLNFVDVVFQIQVRDADTYSPEGADDVEFLISLNPGQPVKPLVNVASGGELSRIMLAIRTVLADKDDTETLIFDEIDTGISGRTAQKVSEKMALIAGKRQVICITHLAQIAAMADCHYLISKEVVDADTRTKIQRLDEEASVMELARILGGARITDTVVENAREMRKLAKEGAHSEGE